MTKEIWRENFTVTAYLVRIYSMESKPEDFAVALGALEQELDWELLGRFQCSEGGESFFSPEQIEAQREAGLRIAGGLGELLMADPSGVQRSLYVGAAVGELIPILMEHFVLGREVQWINLANEETTELNRALAAVELQGVSMPRVSTDSLESVEGPFDHAWLVSVLNDPDAFPALHDELYGRSGELATGRGSLTEDLAAANALTDTLLAKLSPKALLSTTDEELPILRPRLASGGWSMKATTDAILTAVVGDPLRFLRLNRPES
jgi:hypothetical protein